MTNPTPAQQRNEDFLRDFELRKGSDPTYSQNRYAEDLGLSEGTVSGRLRQAKVNREKGVFDPVFGLDSVSTETGNGNVLPGGSAAQSMETEIPELDPEIDPLTENKIEDTVSGNERTISVVGQITTLDQLLEICRVDTDIWMVENYLINTWPVGRKETVKDITFKEGVMTGKTTDTGKIYVQPLFQVKARLIRKEPEPITPAIHPVYITVRAGKFVPPKRNMYAALIWPDPQAGFIRDLVTGGLTPLHDRLALDVVLQVAQELRPDRSVWLGDIGDLAEWSDHFIRGPEFYWTTQATLIEAAWWIQQGHKYSDKTDVIEGNHEDRIRKALTIHLQSAYGLKAADQLDAEPLLSVDNLLGLSRSGIQYHSGYPGAEVWINDLVRCEHGDKARSGGGTTSSSLVKEIEDTTIFGHIHRIEMAMRTLHKRDGRKTVMAFSPGCLCHVDGRVPSKGKKMQWQQGFSVIWYNKDWYQIVPAEIRKGSAVLNGKLFEGRDQVDMIRDSVPEDYRGMFG